MTSREEYRQQQSAAQNQQHYNKPVAPRRTHWKTVIGLAACLWVLLVSFWLYRTILSKEFAAEEVKQTVVADQLNQEVDNVLASYAVPRSVLTKHESVKLARQAVNNVYDNQAIDVDMSAVTNRLESSVSSLAGNYGVDVSSVAGSSLNALTNQLNSAVNQRLNTQHVKTFTKQLHLAKVINVAALAISGILTIVLLVSALVKRNLIPIVSWSLTIVSLLAAGSIMVSGSVARQVSRAVPDFSSSIISVWSDVAQFGWHLVILAVVLAAMCWIARIIVARRGSRG
ncbi:hypothetical protein [uncultured Limosilactobacillus sp.]|uniref:hypothetical protein n=1 Tax=uncultured Limosilactobacillus sp. TaxID=2837629 RepID=UPI0025F8E019|nr:hypothetical protein [uncultured Limosilactobacillus sp.]